MKEETQRREIEAATAARHAGEHEREAERALDRTKAHEQETQLLLEQTQTNEEETHQARQEAIQRHTESYGHEAVPSGSAMRRVW